MHSQKATINHDLISSDIIYQEKIFKKSQILAYKGTLLRDY